jgi:hypothetical protein
VKHGTNFLSQFSDDFFRHLVRPNLLFAFAAAQMAHVLSPAQNLTRSGDFKPFGYNFSGF